MSAASHDRELEEALANAAQLRHRYRAASQDEPPDAVDALIRAAARDQATTRPRPARSPLTASWRVPLSIAAVVVVSATVSVLVAERHGQLPPEADHPVGAPSAVSKEEKRTEPAAPQRQLPTAPADRFQGKGRLVTEPPRRATSEPAMAPQAASKAFSVRPESSQEPLKTQQPAAQAPSQNAAAPGATQQPPPAPASQPGESERPQSLRDEARTEERAKQQSPDAVAPEERAAPLRKESAPRAVAPATIKLERDGVVAAKKSASVRPAWESDPEAWLKHINELRVAGQGADAEASFREFRDRYPDYQLPAGFVVPER
jgi:hypothetical protein